MILPGEDMPVTREGITPDIIVNPHAIPSRMTVGQLVEVIMGKLGCSIGACGDATAFTKINPEDISDVLESRGYERYGNETLYNGRVGTQLKCSIFIGPTYYQRLKHMVGDKYNSRGGDGPRTALTHQPTSGRANGGGLRIGEMERDALLSHGAMAFLKESMMERSDGPSPDKRIPAINICNKTGLIDVIKNGVMVGNDGNNSGDYSEVHIPYACKLMLQEFQSMSIAPRLITESVARDWAPTKKIIDDKEADIEERTAIVPEEGIPAELVSLFKRKRTRDSIMSDTDVVLYSVISVRDRDTDGEKHFIKLGGNRVTIRYATEMIKNIINERKQGIYLTKYEIALPNRIIDKWRSGGYSKLKELKSEYKLKNIDIGIRDMYDPRGDTRETFRNVTIHGIKKFVDEFRGMLEVQLNNFYKDEERRQRMMKPTKASSPKPKFNYGPVNPLFAPPEQNIKMEVVDSSNYEWMDVIRDPSSVMEAIGADDYQLIAGVGRYLVVIQADDDEEEDDVTYIYIDMEIFDTEDEESEAGISLDKPDFLGWLTLPLDKDELADLELPLSRDRLKAIYESADFR